MNITTIFKSLLAAALFSGVLFGLLSVNTDLPIIGTVIAYIATLAIFGLAAFDGVKRTT